MTTQTTEPDRAKLMFDAQLLAKESKRPVYIIDGAISQKRPTSGPHLVVWPNGSVTALGWGRKRTRKKVGADAGEEATSPEESLEEE